MKIGSSKKLNKEEEDELWYLLRDRMDGALTVEDIRRLDELLKEKKNNGRN